MNREIESPQRMPRLIAFKLNGVGTAALDVGSKDGVLTDNGVGDYSIALNKPFARVPVVSVVSATADCVIQVASASASVLNVLVKSAAGVAKDAELHILVHGFDAKDEY